MFILMCEDVWSPLLLEQVFYRQAHTLDVVQRTGLHQFCALRGQQCRDHPGTLGELGVVAGIEDALLVPNRVGATPPLTPRSIALSRLSSRCALPQALRPRPLFGHGDQVLSFAHLTYITFEVKSAHLLKWSLKLRGHL